MEKRLSLVLVAVFCVTLFAGCGPDVRSAMDRIQANKEIIVGVKGDTPPFGYHDRNKQLRGFDVELAGAIAMKLGVKPKFVPLTTAERIPALQNRRVDLVAACMTITRERERLIDFTMPYFETSQGLLVRADSPINDYLDLEKKKVGATKGSTGMAMMKIVQPDAVIVPFDGYKAAMTALKAGTIDALATDHIILVGLLKGKTDQFKIAGSFGWEPYGLGIRENDSALRGKVNEVLQEMWDEGLFQEIYDSWFGEKGQYPTGSAFTMTTFPKGNLK